MNASLYFHVPFCTQKCPYCHFYVIPNRLAYQQLLSEGLALEWRRQLPLLEGKTITSIYFGGGTPSLFRGVEEILRQIPRSKECEITIEANPEESSRELFEHFREIGINRLSLGVQSLDDRSLQVLERIHSAEKARSAIWNAQKAGFENVSIDLMYDLPGQTEESWLYTLDQLEELPIHHLSLYNLTIEPHTSFHKRNVKTPGGELSFRFLTSALGKFQELGFERYEISAFSLPGRQSLHNVGYWTGRPFLGYGPSAFSYWEKERFQNVPNLHKYARLLKESQSPVGFREKLSDAAHAHELFAIHLRLTEGVGLDQYPISGQTQQTLRKLSALGLLQLSNERAQLTERGMLFYDTVASELI